MSVTQSSQTAPTLASAMTTHLEQSLQRDVDRIHDSIMKMAGVAVRSLRDCVAALQKRDRQMALLIILRDQRIDQLEKENDRLCLEFLVRHQPAASQLRFTYATLQMNFELERVGDYAESIARQILKLLELNCEIPADLFTEISSASISMLENAASAFARQDASLAEMTSRIEEHVDNLRNQTNTELMHLVQNNRLPLAALSPLMTIARRFERVSDQAKSICQETIYLRTGEYAKHAGAHIYRVLFVDNSGGATSRLAQAIGESLRRPEFAFSSASTSKEESNLIEVDLLREKGINRPSGTLVPLAASADLDSFQAIIPLSSNTKKQLPATSRKTVVLEWDVPNAGANAALSQPTREEFEKLYHLLYGQITQLVEALVGNESTVNIASNL